MKKLIQVEGYKAFHGSMLIAPKNVEVTPITIKGDWLYKPDTECWYCNGNSFPSCICKVVEID